jgi:hemerythrin-like domain-containing protein
MDSVDRRYVAREMAPHLKPAHLYQAAEVSFNKDLRSASGRFWRRHMPVVIGGKPESTFADPIGLLGDCHRRIERFLSVLLQIASEAHGGRLSEEQRDSWGTALRYFREAAPKHTADEEESLFPRLRQINRPEVQALLTRVNILEEEHIRAGKAHDEVDRLGRLWLDEGSLSRGRMDRLSTVLAQLSELYRRHIALEDGKVFPLAATVLPAAERRVIGAEMASRRGLKLPP